MSIFNPDRDGSKCFWKCPSKTLVGSSISKILVRGGQQQYITLILQLCGASLFFKGMSFMMLLKIISPSVSFWIPAAVLVVP